MSMYNSVNSTNTTTPATVFTREDILQYQTDLNNYLAQFQSERCELEAMLGDVRNAQYNYDAKIATQDARIDALSTLVISLVNKLEALNGAGGNN